jgi:hypothetical protein
VCIPYYRNGRSPLCQFDHFQKDASFSGDFPLQIDQFGGIYTLWEKLAGLQKGKIRPDMMGTQGIGCATFINVVETLSGSAG